VLNERIRLVLDSDPFIIIQKPEIMQHARHAVVLH
jgi:hypothetical protein